VSVAAAKGALLFRLEKPAAFASQGGGQGPECRDTRQGKRQRQQWRGGGGHEGNPAIIPQQLYHHHHQTDHRASSAKAEEMPRSQRSLQSLLQQTGKSSYFICFDHPNSSQSLSGIQISSQLGDLLLSHREGAWGQGSVLAFTSPKAASRPPCRPWYGSFLIPVEIMLYEGKFICWCQKGTHNWHSQLIHSPPTDKG